MLVICMGVWNSGMRRRKTIILTVCSFTLESVMSYSQYRLESIDMGDASACAWRLGRADLQADLTVVEVFELVYQNSIKDIEMGEMYSNSVFTLTPALSAGLLLDPSTGMILGTTQSEMPATACTITANQFMGDEVTISVELSTGTKSLITLVAMTDL